MGLPESVVASAPQIALIPFVAQFLLPCAGIDSRCLVTGRPRAGGWAQATVDLQTQPESDAAKTDPQSLALGLRVFLNRR